MDSSNASSHVSRRIPTKDATKSAKTAIAKVQESRGHANIVRKYIAQGFTPVNLKSDIWPGWGMATIRDFWRHLA